MGDFGYRGSNGVKDGALMQMGVKPLGGGFIGFYYQYVQVTFFQSIIF